ncbi:endonuclease/exonuclease/phosphatase family protein [Biformimicrobium ophioploci]|uniref:Endonuclease/exonuclease/phosphatase family protein n=1 Tax=Biformimicrobium ophioploci TaxID=3036711 RepID=A0ABQ6LXC1_9GAMM|nr:endonuclease/exonuclease/phosphatase family protein [Microbulbifer sp. NKW57]GMG86747.1 endonuclease/exonuclease/phosphatase family protein [Microbulbifer sp. NKW57]
MKRLLLPICAAFFLPFGFADSIGIDASVSKSVGHPSCGEPLARHLSKASLDPTAIRLVNWNILKGNRDGWREDLHRFAEKADLVLLQEATHHMLKNAALPNHSAAFSQGYVDGELKTGVLTYSRARVAEHCSLSALEPWLNTPKAVSITEHPLKDLEHTLMVVNIHSINFAFGLKEYLAQLAPIVEMVAKHDGPVIVAGDFNTWSAARSRELNKLAARLSLKPVEFGQDQRIRILGKALDHIYVRGLKATAAHTWDTESSDHNPMRVDLTVF